MRYRRTYILNNDRPLRIDDIIEYLEDFIKATFKIINIMTVIFLASGTMIFEATFKNTGWSKKSL